MCARNHASGARRGRRRAGVGHSRVGYFRDRSGRFLSGGRGGPGRGNLSAVHRAARANAEIQSRLEDVVVAYLGDEVLSGEHGDVADFDRRVASALAVAFEGGWSGVVVAVAEVEDGKVVRGTAQAMAAGGRAARARLVLADLGFPEL